MIWELFLKNIFIFKSEFKCGYGYYSILYKEKITDFLISPFELYNKLLNFIINLSYTDFSKKVKLYRKQVINRNLTEKCCCLKPWPTLHLINHFLFTAGKYVHIRSYHGRADMLWNWTFHVFNVIIYCHICC